MRIMIVAYMPRNILEVIHSISEDKTFPPSHNLAQISRIAKGFAPMLTTILKDYIEQNTSVAAMAVRSATVVDFRFR